MPRGTMRSPYDTVGGRLDQAVGRASRLEAMLGNSRDSESVQVTTRTQDPWEDINRASGGLREAFERNMRELDRTMMEVSFPANYNVIGPRSLLQEVQWAHEILRNFPAPSDRTPEQQEEIMLLLIEISENSNNNPLD